VLLSLAIAEVTGMAGAHTERAMPIASGASQIVDVLVYGANSGGIGAAIAASDAGKTVALMEPLHMIGGMGAAGGVGLMNQGAGDASCTGLCRKWGALNARHYNASSAPDELNLFPDMFVMAESWWTMLKATPHVTTRLGCRLVRVVRGRDACLASADFLCHNDSEAVTIAASVFVDASYDGDVMVAAGGIDYASGREPADKYNESLAGVNTMDVENESFDKQGLSIDAHLPNGQLLPGVSRDPLPPDGTGDNRLMAFSYFPCVTTNTSNAIPYYAPAGYDPERYALLQRQILGVIANGRFPHGPDLSYFSESHAYSSTPGAEKLLLCCGVGPVNCDEPDQVHNQEDVYLLKPARLASRLSNHPHAPNFAPCLHPWSHKNNDCGE